MSLALKTPFADALPALPAVEFDNLRADLLENGQRDPILVDGDGNILDGHHRYKILGAKAEVRTIKIPPEEREAFAIRANLNRRNLSIDQKKAIRERQQAITLDLNGKGWTQERIAGVVGVARETVRDWLAFITNGGTANANNPVPAGPANDCRVKMGKNAKAAAAKLLEQGQTQKQIADEFGVAQPTISNLAKKIEKEKERAAQLEEAAKQPICNSVIVGDFRKECDKVDDESVDLIFTDPPYDRKSVGLYEDLAEFAKAKLRRGGSCLAYGGQYLTREILEGMSKHLRFWWIIACAHSGKLARMREYGIVVAWKPIFWFVKGTRADKAIWLEDLISGGGRQKATHAWQQAQSEAEHFIEKLCPKKGLVCDPFLGGGTTAAAAKGLGRNWVGFEIDRRSAAIASRRIGK